MSTAIMTREFFQKHGSSGGKKAAKGMTAEERKARAVKASKAAQRARAERKVARGE